MHDRASTDVADRLVPEAFAGRTTAYALDRVERLAGSDAFSAWVAWQLERAVQFRYPFGGRACGLVVVEGAGLRWTWDRQPCEELAWLTDRVREEVCDVAEPWVLVANLRWPEPTGVGVRDGGTGAAEDVELPAPSRRGVPWYAEARGRGAATVRTGLVLLDGERAVGTAALPAGSPFERAATRVLHGHPDRRRHREGVR